jgi:beta-mannanase
MPHHLRLATFLIALTCAVVGPTPAQAAIRPVAHRVTLGVATPRVSASSAHPGRALERYAAKVGRMPRIAMWYQTWQGGPLIAHRVMRAVKHHHVIPMITWLPETNPLDRIAAGDYDGYLRDSAAAARAWGRRILLRPFSEMNGRWMPWGVGAHGNTAQQFIAAWRHIVSIFHSAGAGNVRFVFSPNVISPNSPDFTSMYPGDRYVDRVALDGYNWGTSVRGQHWRSFHEIFADSYAVLARLSSRPMLIAETASSEVGGRKPRWITHTFRRDMAQLPRIRAVVWFNHRKETSWPVSSSGASLRSYRRIVRAE